MAETQNTLVGKQIQAVPQQPKEIGIDTKYLLHKVLVDGIQTSTIDMSKIEGFTNVSQSREQVYSVIDNMAQDSTLSAVLETYTEDTVEPNDTTGHLMWCESSDSEVASHVNYLLDSFNVDKNLYTWAYNLIKYGDVYLRLYRESEYEDDFVFDSKAEDKRKALTEHRKSISEMFKEVHEEEDALENNKVKQLNEDVILAMHKKNDHYVYYAEMVPNPGEMFELTKFGKTMGYVQAPSTVLKNFIEGSSLNPYFTYQSKKKDVKVYAATDFVHGCLDVGSNRVPEEFNVYQDDGSDKHMNYIVKRGQSLFYNSFKVWRELCLLENSILLNRLTKSSIVKLIQIECGDMPDEQAQLFLNRLKDKIEQKMAISVGDGASEYTNPGPVENIVYTLVHGAVGQISAQELGNGEADPKSLKDLEFFRDKLFANLRAPKQFFGVTDDASGFNGGSSLAIISSRYGKAIKRIQNILCQMVTDLINLMLIDNDQLSYINKFTIRMQPPVTQNEIDRRKQKQEDMTYMGEIMQQLGDLPDVSAKLKITKALIARVVDNPEVLDVIQEQIDKVEATENPQPTPDNLDKEIKPKKEGPNAPVDRSKPSKGDFTEFENDLLGGNEESTEEPGEETLPSDSSADTDRVHMPTPDELGLDMVDNK